MVNESEELIRQLAPIAYEYIIPDLLEARPKTITALCKAVVGLEGKLNHSDVGVSALYWDRSAGDKLLQEARSIVERRKTEDLPPDKVIEQYAVAIRQLGQNDSYSGLRAFQAGVPLEDILA